jgi:hypothetical protein
VDEAETNSIKILEDEIMMGLLNNEAPFPSVADGAAIPDNEVLAEDLRCRLDEVRWCFLYY